MGQAVRIDLEAYVERNLRECGFLPFRPGRDVYSLTQGQFGEVGDLSKAGVYVIHSASGEILYVGKARCLRRKLSGHFRHMHWQTPSLWQFFFSFFRNQNIELQYRFVLIDSEIERRAVTHLLKVRLDPLFEKVRAKFGKENSSLGETAEYRELRKTFRYSAAIEVLRNHGLGGNKT